MTPKPYSTKLKRDFVECLKKLIEDLLLIECMDDEDKMHLCVLAEIRDRLYAKLAKFQVEYKMQFTAAQAFALRILFVDYVKNPTTYEGNRLQQIAHEVHKHYQ